MARGRARSAAGAALLAAAALVAGCSDDGPRAGDVDPVPLDLAVPTYAVATERGLVVRSGDVRRLFPTMSEAEWLPGGTALLRRAGGRARLWDPGSGDLGPRLPFSDPNRSVTQIDVIGPRYGRAWDAPYHLTAYDLDGRELWRTELPLTDNPDADADNELQRSYLSAHTIDGATFLRWSDGSEWYEDGDYGLLRLGPGGADPEEVQVGVPVIAVWLAADGSALLATTRVQGDPCGGCQVTQRLIEIDPATGATVAEHDLPEEYDADWDVREVDKVGDRIAVRFEQTVFGGRRSGYRQSLVQRGTWVLDDDGWSMVPGSDRELSWWQSPDDRIVATPLPARADEPAGYRLGYAWEHDGERTPLPGASTARAPRAIGEYRASVPGQLLPPE